MSNHTVYAVHEFEFRYREYHVKDAPVKTATIRATSKAQARVMWKYDPRSEGNAIVSVERVDRP